MNEQFEFDVKQTLSYVSGGILDAYGLQGGQLKYLSLTARQGDTQSAKITLETTSNNTTTKMRLSKDQLQALVRMYEQIQNEPLFDGVNKEDYEKLYNFVLDTSKVSVNVGDNYGVGGPMEGCSNEEKVYSIVGLARDLIENEIGKDKHE